MNTMILLKHRKASVVHVEASRIIAGGARKSVAFCDDKFDGDEIYQTDVELGPRTGRPVKACDRCSKAIAPLMRRQLALLRSVGFIRGGNS